MDFDRALSRNQQASSSKARKEAEAARATDTTIRTAQEHFDQRVPKLLNWLSDKGVNPSRIGYGHSKLARHSPPGVVAHYYKIGRGFTIQRNVSSVPRRPESVTVILASGRIYYGAKGDSINYAGIRGETDAYYPSPSTTSMQPDLPTVHQLSGALRPDELLDDWFERIAVRILANHKDLNL